MADGGDGGRRVPEIPSWQRNIPSLPPKKTVPSEPQDNNPSSQTSDDPIEQARTLLQEDSVKNQSREEKTALLEKRGLQADDVQKLLGDGQLSPNEEQENEHMKTIFDSNAPLSSNAAVQSATPSSSPLAPSSTVGLSTSGYVAPKQDLPPIITYPEFLLKPQKPPPLVTIDRLAYAGYIVAGVSALTWGASRYLVAPMRESLSSARHDLQSSTLTSLETLNTKLESAVSHVPYIQPLSHKSSLGKYHDNDDAGSVSSSDSDPTELFHRDIATQTSPPASRRSSVSSTSSNLAAGATIAQTRRLTDLHSSLSSLLSSTQTSFSTSALSDSMGDLQNIIDKIESNSQPLYSSYDWRSSGIATKATTPAWSATTTHSASMPALSSNRNKTDKDKDVQTEAAKFKAEIRALKGAFLSSRNFPTARPVAPSTGSGIR